MKKETDSIHFTPKIESDLHWNNSSNVLCNYMKKQEYLDLILKNQAIIPRYVIEPIDYLELEGLQKICFPMTCFCDIPFSKVSSHMSYYGKYGIGLAKTEVIKKNRVQPIHYMSPKSPLTEDFREAFLTYYNVGESKDESTNILLNYLVSTLVYMKPIWGQEKNKEGVYETYIYQDECEWRYIPSDNFPDSLGPIILPQDNTSEKAKEIYSKALAEHRECWLSFDWEDVNYIIVPDEKAEDNTIETIVGLGLDMGKQNKLISKIEISKHFADNM